MPKLVINPKTPQAREIELKPGANFLGRGFANDFTIEDASVSSSHAQIVVDGHSVMVRDLGSTNGTCIDREPVTESALRPGQILRLGGVEMLLQADPPPSGATNGGVVALPSAAGAPPAVRVRVAAPASTRAESAMPAPSGGGLRLAGHSPAPSPTAAAEAEPPLPPPIPPPFASTQAKGKSVCKFHPKSPARWLCPQCGQLYCDLCVGTRGVAGGTGYFCRPCGAQCSPVTPKIDLGRGQESFFSRLPGAFAYPFQHSGAIILVCGTIFFALVGFARGFSLYLQIVFLGYLFAYMQNIIHTTAHGDETEAPFPEVSNFMEDILGPCLQLIGTVLLCFGPAIGLRVWSAMGGGTAPALGFIPALALGCLYFPMAFLGVAMFDSVSAINPLLVVPAICKVPLQYLVACLVLGVVFTVRWTGAALLPKVIPIPIVPTIISSFIGLYFLTVQSRILGLLYYHNKQRLGWFSR